RLNPDSLLVSGDRLEQIFGAIKIGFRLCLPLVDSIGLDFAGLEKSLNEVFGFLLLFGLVLLLVLLVHLLEVVLGLIKFSLHCVILVLFGLEVLFQLVALLLEVLLVLFGFVGLILDFSDGGNDVVLACRIVEAEFIGDFEKVHI